MDRWRKGAHIDLAYARRGRHICDPAPVGRERRVRIRELALQELLRLARLQLQGATQCLWSDVSLLGASGLIAGTDLRLHGHGRVGLCLHCISPFCFVVGIAALIYSGEKDGPVLRRSASFLRLQRWTASAEPGMTTTRAL